MSKIPPEKWLDNVLRRAERSVKQSPFHHKVVFWLSIIVVVKANLALSAVLVPFLAALNHPFFDFTILLTALLVGFSYNYLLSNVAHLEKGHYFLALVIVPLIAIANVFLIGSVVEQFFRPRADLWLIAALYGIVFVLPYGISSRRFIKNWA